MRGFTSEVGLFVPSGTTTTEPEWGSGKQPAGETRQTALTGLTWHVLTPGENQTSNKVREIKLFLYLYHNQGRFKLQRVVFLPADTQPVFSRYFLCSSLVVNSWKTLICLYLAFRLFSVCCRILPLNILFGLNVSLDFQHFFFHQTVSLSSKCMATELDPRLTKLIWKQHTKLKC